MRYYKLNSRLLWHSKLFVLFLIIIGGYITYQTFFFLAPEQYVNSFFLLESAGSLQVSFFVFAFGIAIYFAQASTVTEWTCLVPKGKIRFFRFAALYCSSFVLVLLLVICCVINLIRTEASFQYCIRASVEISAQYGLLLMLAQSLGFAVGSMGKSIFSYLCIVPATLIFSHLNQSVFLWLTGESTILAADAASNIAKLSDLLTVGAMNPNSLDIDFAGPMLGHLFGLRCGVKILLCIPIILAICGGWSRTPRKLNTILRSLSGGVCIILSIVLGFVFFNLYPTKYICQEKLLQDYHYDSYIPGYRITAYEGQIEIAEPLSVHCNITVEAITGGDLVLRLDEGFTPTFIYDGEELNYAKERDMITISEDVLPKRDSFIIQATYKNRICYISDLYNIELFATDNGLAALPSSFALLPEIPNDDTLHNYNIDLRGGLSIASNLTVDGTQLSGTASTICIFSGFFDSIKLGDVDVVFSDANGMIQPYQTLQRLQDYGIYRDGEQNLMPVNGTFAPQKLLILRYTYDTGWIPVQYGDYGIGDSGLG